MAVNDRETLRRLAARWMEIAGLPVMAERKRLWTALKDLRPERPMLLFETWTLLGYVPDSELQCEDPALRAVERQMRWNIRQFEEVGDDIVLEPCWRVGWHTRGTGYGVDVPSRHATDSTGDQVGYRFDHPIRTPADLDRLQARTWQVDRDITHRWHARLSETFGDILPVVLHGTMGIGGGLTYDAFRLLGNDGLLTWPYDEPEALHRLMAFLRDDRLAYFDFLEQEGLLGLNNIWTFVGSGSPGFTTLLPQADHAGRARLRDVWLGMESQETTCISPAMFGEFFLPYMAEVSRRFGRVYYGCCEPVHDRWDRLTEAIPHIGGVSISPWCDMRVMGEKLGRSCVFSRKPRPAPISGDTPDWVALAQDLDETFAAARGCCLEIVYRDVYRINDDRPRLRRWVQMARERMG